jgi:hypothetical protein
MHDILTERFSMTVVSNIFTNYPMYYALNIQIITSFINIFKNKYTLGLDLGS